MDRDVTASSDLVGTSGSATFGVEPAHATTAFGDQDVPPGRPAAADATPDESVRVLGTAHLLSRVEFTGRESLNGRIPPGTGVVGQTASVTHTGAAPIGTTCRVATEVTAVDGPSIAFDGTVTTVDDREIGTASVVLRLVERDQFRAAVADDDP